MRKEDWQNAFGGTPEVFGQRVRATLNGLQEEEKVKKKLSFSVAAALLAALMLMGTAVAAVNGFGITDFMGKFGVEMPTKLADAIETADASAATERVVYSVQEVLLDDSYLRMTFVCEPKDPEHTILAGVDEDTEWDLHFLNGDSVQGAVDADSAETVSLAELAEQKGLNIVRAYPSSSAVEWLVCGEDYVMRDGRLYYYMEYQLAEKLERDEDGLYHFVQQMNDCPVPGDGTDVQSASLEIIVNGVESEWATISVQGEAGLPLGHYTVDSIDVQISDHEIRYNVHLHVNPDVYILASVYDGDDFSNYAAWLPEGITQDQLVFEDIYGFDLMLDEETQNPNCEYGYVTLPEEVENHPIQLLTPGTELVFSRCYLLNGDAPTMLNLRCAGDADEAGSWITCTFSQPAWSWHAAEGKD